MQDFATWFADRLESIAGKVRTLTVDRVERGIRLASLGMVAATLALLAVLFLMLTIYAALAIPLGSWGAFSVIGGLFLIGGLLLWRARRGGSPT